MTPVLAVTFLMSRLLTSDMNIFPDASNATPSGVPMVTFVLNLLSSLPLKVRENALPTTTEMLPVLTVTLKIHWSNIPPAM